MTSNIRKTRRGYAYQDKFALLLLLKRLTVQPIDLYLDYPYEIQESIDIRVVLNSSQEEIYEVKTGESYLSSPEEIYESLAKLFEYKSQADTDVQCNIIVEKYSNKFGDIQNDLKFIKQDGNKERESDNKTPVDVAEYMIENIKSNLEGSEYKINDLSGESFRGFVKNANFEKEATDKLDDDTDRMSPLEDKIINRIDDIANQSSEYEYEKKLIRTEAIYREMLYVMRSNAGSEKDLSGDCLEALAKQFALRSFMKYLDPKYSENRWHDHQQHARESLGLTDADIDNSELYSSGDNVVDA